MAPPILIGSICKHLADDKELQRSLRSDSSLIPAATEEFIRLYSPYRGFARTASKEICLHGKTISPREPITLVYTSANRDPTLFANPNEFILNRPNIKAHLGFGRGRHQCAGMPLARLYDGSCLIIAILEKKVLISVYYRSIQIMLKVILDNTKDLEEDGPLEYARMPELGIIGCPMKFCV